MHSHRSLHGSCVLGPDCAAHLPLISCLAEFTAAWVWHGDQIALQYAGTMAMKRDLTLTGHRTAGGVLRDGVTAVQRYYLALAKDAERLASFELLRRGGFGRLKRDSSELLTARECREPQGKGEGEAEAAPASERRATRGEGLIQQHQETPAGPAMRVAVPAAPAAADGRNALQSPLAGAAPREGEGLGAGPSSGFGGAPVGSGLAAGSLPPIGGGAKKPLPPLPTEGPPKTQPQPPQPPDARTPARDQLPPIAGLRQVIGGQLPSPVDSPGNTTSGDTDAPPPPPAASNSDQLRALQEAEAKDTELRSLADRALAEAEGRVMEVTAQLLGAEAAYNNEQQEEQATPPSS